MPRFLLRRDARADAAPIIKIIHKLIIDASPVEGTWVNSTLQRMNAEVETVCFSLETPHTYTQPSCSSPRLICRAAVLVSVRNHLKFAGPFVHHLFKLTVSALVRWAALLCRCSPAFGVLTQLIAGVLSETMIIMILLFACDAVSLLYIANLSNIIKSLYTIFGRYTYQHVYMICICFCSDYFYPFSFTACSQNLSYFCFDFSINYSLFVLRRKYKYDICNFI